MGLAVRVGLVLAVAATDKCGPSRREVGEAVLIAWPLVVLLAALPQLGLLALWRKLRADVSLAWRPVAALVAVATLTSGFAIATAPEHPFRWAAEALWLFGTSYGALLFVVTRIWLMGDRRYVFVGPHLLASLGFIPLAMALRAGLFDGLSPSSDPELIFILPGYGGWITGGVALALAIEWYVRRKQAAPAASVTSSS